MGPWGEAWELEETWELEYRYQTWELEYRHGTWLKDMETGRET